MTAEDDPDKCLNRGARIRETSNHEKEEEENKCCKDINLKCANHIRPVLDCHQSGKINKENYEINDSNIKFEPQIRWLDLIAILYVHLGCVYGLYLLVCSRSLKSYIWRKY